jgi:hypothetical protein
VRPSLIVLLLLLAPAAVRAQLTPVERRGLIETLYLGNANEDDLKSIRRSRTPLPFEMPLVNLAVDDPIEAANRLLVLHQTAHGSLAQQIRAACSQGFGDPTDLKTTVPAPLDLPPEVPEAIRPAVAQLAADIDEANASIRTALARLTDEEKRDVIESLPRWASPDPTFSPDFAKRPQLSQRALLSLIAKIDLAAIRRAGRKLSASVEAELPELRKNADAVTAPINFQVHGVIVELTGKGDDTHVNRDANLCIDFGGDNTYTGRYGAGVGYASVLIDFGRRDRIEGPDANVGSGILGIGLAYFAGEGDCVFTGGSLSFGVGLAGVGGLSKHLGNDRYTAGTLSEGAGAFGIGILLDSGGDDQYTASTGAQGYGRTGGFGWLIDQSGNDVYRTDSGQGFGSGVLTADGLVAGGAGLLTDLAGDDVYIGGTGCQAAGDAGGLGSLFDGSGRDTYSAIDQAQSSAQHQAAAYFFDLAGDDSYSIHGGLGHATSVDRSVALFLDRAGNDLYSSLDTHPGTAIEGSLAIFLDAEGNDRYQGDVTAAFPSPGPSSLGVFADLGGSDGYASTESFEGEASVQAGRKIAYDAPTPPDNLTVTPLNEHKFPPVGSQAMKSAPQMERLYRDATAETGSTAAVDQFVAMGKPAFDWLMKEKLGSDERFRNRPFIALAKVLGKPAQDPLAAKINDFDDTVALAALNICIEGEFGAAGPQLEAALLRPALQKSAVIAAGELGIKSLIKPILKLASSPDHLLVYEALTSLVELRSQEGLDIAKTYMSSSDMTIRDVAIAYLSLYPAEAVAAARASLASGDERIQRIGIEILAKASSTEALDLIAPYLSKGTMGLKIQALLALDGRCPPAARAEFLALRDDPNALIKAIAARTDPGR